MPTEIEEILDFNASTFLALTGVNYVLGRVHTSSTVYSALGYTLDENGYTEYYSLSDVDSGFVYEYNPGDDLGLGNENDPFIANDEGLIPPNIKDRLMKQYVNSKIMLAGGMAAYRDAMEFVEFDMGYRPEGNGAVRAALLKTGIFDICQPAPETELTWLRGNERVPYESPSLSAGPINWGGGLNIQPMVNQKGVPGKMSSSTGINPPINKKFPNI